MARKTVLALVLVAAAWAIFSHWQSDARRIGRQFEELQTLASKSALERDLEGANRARLIADLFAGSFEVRAEPENYATSNRQDLIRGVLLYRGRSRTLLVRAAEEELFVERDGNRATLYAMVDFVNDLGDFAGADSYPVRIEWVKEGGDWKIRKFEILNEP